VTRHGLGCTLLAIVTLIIASGCVHVPPMQPQAPTPAASCRQVVGDDPIRWIGPDVARDRLRLAEWCETVGPVLVHRADGSSAASAGAGELAVVSWNTHVGGGDVHELLVRLRRGDFTGGTPQHRLVVLLQEVFRRGDGVPRRVAEGLPVPHRIATAPPAGARRDVREIAAAEGMSFVYAPAMRNGRDNVDPEDRGNAILTTETLGDVTVIELPMERQRRVAIAAAIMSGASWSDARPLVAVTAHFDTGLALTRGGPMAARRRQADALVNALALVPAPDVIIGGDFNSWLGDAEPAVQHLSRVFPERAEHEPATWRGAGVEATLDHMFVGLEEGDAVTRRVPRRFGSDHYPLITTIARD
jgi:endonuclease/exonuclease/phosphatase family metal-dependent hydrolase